MNPSKRLFTTMSMKSNENNLRVAVGHPFPHHIVILLSYSHITCFTSICTNFVAYVLLKWAYLWFFDRINCIDDEYILKCMKLFSVANGLFSITLEIIRKVKKQKFL